MLIVNVSKFLDYINFFRYVFRIMERKYTAGKREKRKEKRKETQK